MGRPALRPPDAQVGAAVGCDHLVPAPATGAATGTAAARRGIRRRSGDLPRRRALRPGRRGSSGQTSRPQPRSSPANEPGWLPGNVTFEVADMQNSPGGGRPLRRGDEPARRDVIRRPLDASTNIRGHHRVMKSQERRRRGNHHLRRSTGTCLPLPSAPWHKCWPTSSSRSTATCCTSCPTPFLVAR